MWRPLLDVRDAPGRILRVSTPTRCWSRARSSTCRTETCASDWRSGFGGRCRRSAFRRRSAASSAIEASGATAFGRRRSSGRLGFGRVVSIEESVEDIVTRLREFGHTDFENQVLQHSLDEDPRGCGAHHSAFRLGLRSSGEAASQVLRGGPGGDSISGSEPAPRT